MRYSVIRNQKKYIRQRKAVNWIAAITTIITIIIVGSTIKSTISFKEDAALYMQELREARAAVDAERKQFEELIGSVDK